MSEMWLENLRSLIKHQDFVMLQFKSELDRALNSTRMAQDDLRLLRSQIDEQISELQNRFAILDNMRDDPAVLIRAYGANCDTYHSAAERCGLVRSDAPKAGTGYRAVLLGEAIANGRRPCKNCGWRVQGSKQSA
jgi:hypothetical protein